jgi:hypothetical protein
MSRRYSIARLAPVVVNDDLVGRVEVRRDPHRPTVRLLEVNGRMYGAVDLEEPANLGLGYLARLRTVVDTLLPAGRCQIIHLGGGAFALPRALASRRPELTQVVVERSERIIRLAEQELQLRPTASLAVVHDDARALLRSSGARSFDAVVGDAFVGRETPRHLATVEFAADVARVLRVRGIYVVNLIDAPPWPVLAAHAATVRTALPHLLAVAAPQTAQLRESGNVLLVASRRPIHRPTLEYRLDTARERMALVPGRRLAALADRARPRHDADG